MYEFDEALDLSDITQGASLLEKTARPSTGKMTADEWISKNPRPEGGQKFNELLSLMEITKSAFAIAQELQRQFIVDLARMSASRPEKYTLPAMSWTSDPKPNIIYDGIARFKTDGEHSNPGCLPFAHYKGQLHYRLWHVAILEERGSNGKPHYTLKEKAVTEQLSKAMAERNISVNADATQLPAMLAFPCGFTFEDLVAWKSLPNAEKVKQPHPVIREAISLGINPSAYRDEQRLIYAVINKHLEQYVTERNSAYNAALEEFSWVREAARSSYCGHKLTIPNSLEERANEGDSLFATLDDVNGALGSLDAFMETARMIIELRQEAKDDPTPSQDDTGGSFDSLMVIED